MARITIKRWAGNHDGCEQWGYDIVTPIGEFDGYYNNDAESYWCDDLGVEHEDNMRDFRKAIAAAVKERAAV